LGLKVAADKFPPRPLGSRVWTAGRFLVLAGALALTYAVFFLASMRIATRTREVKVPDVRGKSATEAGTIISNAGLALRIDPAKRVDPKVAADHVLVQDPDPGAVVRRPRAVRIQISLGPHAPVVPQLTGLSERAAQIATTQEGLKIASIAEIRTTDYPPGVVVAQDPPAKGRALDVKVLVNRAQGGVRYVMPDLIGTPGRRVADILRRDGFLVAIVGDSPYPGLPPDIVIRQTPQAGFQVAFGEPISIEVSR
jgi:beta-lactam-binding protein with PASTA domain